MVKQQRWIVTAEGERPLGDVVVELERLGFVVENVLDAVGCITGTAVPAVAEKARRVRGVSDVAKDAPIDLGRPGGNTW